ncbi:hypothetical protein GWO43_08730 [candidate division KSB1 bacterium]|nr:hypothetical protein [candidate division KSB1 bacterium]NIR72459.1 hypothetical protein [candidate division KSB1 bacterium]NIS24045.1 hypothetical protein [candidate division KSB1 bacterium]NIT70964.1 hypothetical protein [candidate division KSB1 bacterium]NIU27375.1 hypothetical protein [candidate division KSB1 bacterium]
MKHFLLATFLMVLELNLVLSQDADQFAETVDSKYYDFWEGTWFKYENGEIDTSGTYFKVKRGIHPAAFQENWRLVIDSTTTLYATAVRAWDKTDTKWRYVWISEDSLFQVWDGVKVDEDWYIYKTFKINGEHILSRQAWLPQKDDLVLRTSEWSKDNGKSWKLRFKEYYKKID